MKGAVLVVSFWCSVSAALAGPPDPAAAPAQAAQAASAHPDAPAPVDADPAQPAKPEEGFVIEHVPPRMSPEARRVEDRCVRTTTSHAATGRDARQTKGTQGTHGECAGQGFRGDGGADILSGLQTPALH